MSLIKQYPVRDNPFFGRLIQQFLQERLQDDLRDPKTRVAVEEGRITFTSNGEVPIRATDGQLKHLYETRIKAGQRAITLDFTLETPFHVRLTGNFTHWDLDKLLKITSEEEATGLIGYDLPRGIVTGLPPGMFTEPFSAILIPKNGYRCSRLHIKYGDSGCSVQIPLPTSLGDDAAKEVETARKVFFQTGIFENLTHDADPGKPLNFNNRPKKLEAILQQPLTQDQLALLERTFAEYLQVVAKDELTTTALDFSRITREDIKQIPTRVYDPVLKRARLSFGPKLQLIPIDIGTNTVSYQGASIYIQEDPIIFLDLLSNTFRDRLCLR